MSQSLTSLEITEAKCFINKIYMRITKIKLIYFLFLHEKCRLIELIETIPSFICSFPFFSSYEINSCFFLLASFSSVAF